MAGVTGAANSAAPTTRPCCPLRRRDAADAAPAHNGTITILVRERLMVVIAGSP